MSTSVVSTTISLATTVAKVTSKLRASSSMLELSVWLFCASRRHSEHVPLLHWRRALAKQYSTTDRIVCQHMSMHMTGCASEPLVLEDRRAEK